MPNAFNSPNEYMHDPALADIWRTSHRDMKHPFSLYRCPITGGSEKAVRVSWRMDRQIAVIKSHLSASHEKQYVTRLMCHGYGLICHSCVELILKINTRFLFNQVLNPAHPSLLSSRCWPCRVLDGHACLKAMCFYWL